MLTSLTTAIGMGSLVLSQYRWVQEFGWCPIDSNFSVLIETGAVAVAGHACAPCVHLCGSCPESATAQRKAI